MRGTLAYKGEPRREGRRSPCSTSAGTCWSRNSDFWGAGALQCSLQDLSSLTRDWTCAPWRGSTFLTTRTPGKFRTQNLLQCLCEWPGKHPKYRFLGYRCISASRQICRYRTYKQWGSTIRSFGLDVLAMPHGMHDPSSLTRDQTHAPPQWNGRVLTTGLPGKSLNYMFFKN